MGMQNTYQYTHTEKHQREDHMINIHSHNSTDIDCKAFGPRRAFWPRFSNGPGGPVGPKGLREKVANGL